MNKINDQIISDQTKEPATQLGVIWEREGIRGSSKDSAWAAIVPAISAAHYFYLPTQWSTMHFKAGGFSQKGTTNKSDSVSPDNLFNGKTGQINKSSRDVILYCAALLNKQVSDKNSFWIKNEPDYISRLERALKVYEETKSDEEVLLDHWDDYLKKNKRELLQHYKGKYIAVYEDKVIDEDEDPSALAKRVYSNMGYKAIFMPFIQEEEPIYEINL